MESNKCPNCNSILNLDSYTTLKICRYCMIEIPVSCETGDRDVESTGTPYNPNIYMDSSIYIAKCYGPNNLNYLNNWHKSSQLKRHQMMTMDFNSCCKKRINNNIIQNAIEYFIEANHLDDIKEHRNIVRAFPRRKLMIACICHAIIKHNKVPISLRKIGKLFDMTEDDVLDGINHLKTLGIVYQDIDPCSELALIKKYIKFDISSDIEQIIIDVTRVILNDTKTIQTHVLIALISKFYPNKLTLDVLDTCDVTQDELIKISDFISHNIHTYFSLHQLKTMLKLGVLSSNEKVQMINKLKSQNI